MTINPAEGILSVSDLLAADEKVTTVKEVSTDTGDMPTLSKFAATAPRIAHSPFHQFHKRAVEKMIGRPPTAFESATADALWQAYNSMADGGHPKAFTALSAATGAGKTISSCALMAY